ncbi:MAG: ABC transporter permease [Phycisphaerales bacterium]
MTSDAATNVERPLGAAAPRGTRHIAAPWRALRRVGPLGLIGLALLVVIVGACVLSTPYTFGSDGIGPRYDSQVKEARLLPPWWARHSEQEQRTLHAAGAWLATQAEATRRGGGLRAEELRDSGFVPDEASASAARPRYWIGADLLGRDLLVRCLAGGTISLGIGLAAAMISVLIGTAYGATAGWLGGRIDGVMMRIVDVLYGLPYVLLVVLLAVAVDAVVDRHVAASAVGVGGGMLSEGTRNMIGIGTLLVAIGGVSWLTMARVVRGQVLSLRSRPFIEAARAIGVPGPRLFFRHLLPNLAGPIVVYATLTVPQAILQESFLSFLGIGVRAPMPSWGNLTAEGLSVLNPIEVRWWLLLFPCLLLAATLIALNFVGEALRERLDPRGR